MPARKKAAAPETQPEEAPAPAGDTEPESERRTPTRKVSIARDSEPKRAAGHVLTERGWVCE